MATLKMYSKDGKSSGELKASDKIFSVPRNEHVVNQMLTWYLATRRQGTASAKNRAEVSGGGRKPWKQKGTGRARAGDNRMPHWVKGGVVFPPKKREYGFRAPKKVKHLSVKVVLSDKVKEDKLRVIEELSISSPKTKEFNKIFKSLKIKDSALFIDKGENKDLILASRNLPKAKVMNLRHLNVYDLLKYDEVIIAKDALSELEAVYK